MARVESWALVEHSNQRSARILLFTICDSCYAQRLLVNPEDKVMEEAFYFKEESLASICTHNNQTRSWLFGTHSLWWWDALLKP